MTIKIQRFAGFIWIIGILAGSGCSSQKNLTIKGGSYTVKNNQEIGLLVPGPFIEAIEVEREQGVVVFSFRKGETLGIPFSPRKREDWPVGCPGNVYSQRMEIFDLTVDEKTGAILGLINPVLIRNCPENPYQLILREDGEIGGSFTACSSPAECLYFVPDQQGEMLSCQGLELLVEELDREKSAVESWAEQLVDGYGPGVWYFNTAESPLFHHQPESLTLDAIVKELNELFRADRIPTIQVEGQTGSTIRVSISDHQLLTQGLESAGARGYLQVVLYSLASLPGIDCVDFQFPAGDHAQPGIICRSESS